MRQVAAFSTMSAAFSPIMIDDASVSSSISRLPDVPEDYVHRVGRTARAGAPGIAVAFSSDEERPYLRDIEKLTRCSLRAIPALSATPAARNGPIEPPAASNLPREAASRRGRLPRDRPSRPGTTPAAACPLPVRFRHSCAARRQPAAANSEAALLPLGLMVRAKRMQQGTRDMLIARDGEELVCPKGTICGRMTRDANDQITDGDFAVLETCVSPDGQRYVCACCARTVAVREHFRWRVHLRRGWIR